MNYCFYLLAALCALLLLGVFLRPQRIYEFPYFMSAAFAGFILPQAYGIAISYSAPDDWQRDLFLMAFLCLLSCWIGYRFRPRYNILRGMSFQVNANRFAIAGIVLTAIGYLFDQLISTLSPEATGGTQWTGVVTIYLFFANQVFTGFAICLYCALAYRKRIYWLFASIGAALPLIAVVFYGRREPAAMLLMTLSMVFFFGKRAAPPRVAIAAVLVIATLAIPITEQYRQALARGEQFRALGEIDYIEGFKSFSNPTTVSEVRNAMYIIAATKLTGAYGYGADYWNRMVFGFVPAQIVGIGFKESLMIGSTDEDPAALTATEGYTMSVGSTITCLGDTFQQFWFFGALFYAAVGYLFRHLWTMVIGPGNPVFRIFYIQAMVGTMRSVSHGSGELLPALFYSAMFLTLVTLYARERHSPAPA